MPANLMPAAADLIRFLPEIILTVAGTLMMVLDAVDRGAPRNRFGHICSLAAAGRRHAAAVIRVTPSRAGVFRTCSSVDGFATFFRVLVMGVGILTVLSSYRFLRREGAEAGEFHALMLFSIVGQCIMVACNELIMIFIGLEISSIASYVLAGYLRDDQRANESALKYFLLGSFATAFFLYGVALALRHDRHDQPDGHPRAWPSDGGGPPSTGLFSPSPRRCMFVGLGFKVSAAPFQIWAPDVYQGAPTPVSGVSLRRSQSGGLRRPPADLHDRLRSPSAPRWEPLVWLSALLSMTIGNFAALTQTNIKRMLAYSSIAHAGYVLVALTARSRRRALRRPCSTWRPTPS